MKNFSLIIIFAIIAGCSTSKGVYWCGDHPCINKKEREAYFKKTMIVEIRDLENKKYKKDSEYEKIIQQAKLNEKKRAKEEKYIIKQNKIENKRKIKEEKKLAKQIRLEEKKRIKKEKKLAKQIRLEEKKNVEKRKKISKKTELTSDVKNTEIKLSKFSELVEKIGKKNSFKPYPNINDIPD